MSIAIREFDRCIELLWKYGGGGASMNAALRTLEAVRNSYSDLIDAANLGKNASYGEVVFDEHGAQRLRDALDWPQGKPTNRNLTEGAE